MKKVVLSVFWCLSACVVLVSAVLASNNRLGAIVNEVLGEGDKYTGISLYVLQQNKGFDFTSGKADPNGTNIDASHAFRMASVTKTFTAATVLRLVESGKLTLDAPINQVIHQKFDLMLREDGYATDIITVKQLLAHTSGMFDHPKSDNFVVGFLEDPMKEWTREAQIRACVEWGDPVGKPGEKFSYSDTGYVLLGHIIEKATELPLPIAVRNYLKFDSYNLKNIVWERGDSADLKPGQRAHQYFQSKDTFNWNPSVDLYGGGGLVATPQSVAMFYKLLFSGEIFEKSETLELMLSPVGLPEESPYRLGVFEKDYEGTSVYEHGGFWGTLVMYEPTSNTVIAGAVLQQKDYGKLKEVMFKFLQEDT